MVLEYESLFPLRAETCSQHGSISLAAAASTAAVSVWMTTPLPWLCAFQVLDIGDSDSGPDVILKALYKRLDESVSKGDHAAKHIKS